MRPFTRGAGPVHPLRLLLRRFVRRGSLGVIDHTGRRHDFGVARTGPSATVRLHDPALYRRLVLHPTLHVGRAYVDGTLTIEEGRLSDFLEVLLINEYSAAFGENVLIFPVGGVEPGENPINTANRELQEEIGWQVNQKKASSHVRKRRRRAIVICRGQTRSLKFYIPF